MDPLTEPGTRPEPPQPPRRAGRRLLRRRRFRIASHSRVPRSSPCASCRTREKLRVTAPSMFTAANMACGFSAVPLAFSHHSHWAAALMTLAIVMDIADGAVARLVGATSPFGVQLDSLADLISFGLAPAVLVYTWVLPEWPVIAWCAAYLWLACAAFRLARFNFTIDPTADKRYFVGLPSPGRPPSSSPPWSHSTPRSSRSVRASCCRPA